MRNRSNSIDDSLTELKQAISQLPLRNQVKFRVEVLLITECNDPHVQVEALQRLEEELRQDYGINL